MPPAALPREDGLPFALFELAVAHHQAGRPGEAEALYRRIVLVEPAHVEAWSNLGLALMARGAYPEAVQACVTGIAVRPDHAAAHLNLIEALTRAGHHEQAVAIYRRAVLLLPDRADLPSNLGTLLEALGRPEEALEAYAASLAVQPDGTAACLAAARLLTGAGRLDEAVAVLEAAVACRPDFCEALSTLGTLYNGLSRFAAAVEVSARAFALRPDVADVAINYGVALQTAGRPAEAEAIYRHASTLDPTRPGPHANRGVALQELLRFDEAAEAFEQAIALDPDFASAVVEAIKVRRHICDWSRYDEDRRALLRILAERRDVVFMLLLMTFESTPQEQFVCARQSMARLNAGSVPARLAVAPAPSADGRLRIGYLSHDFRDHPVGRLLPELFARHDRTRVAVTAYALGTEDAGAVRQRIRAGVERFVDLHPLSDREAAHRIAADGIDLLVDLTGPTVGARLPIIAMRPAPIQASFLGWPGTMGLNAIDYVIADGFLLREEDERHYAEKIVRLPGCYQPSDNARGDPACPVTRQLCGLPEDAFVFCSFNNTSKITPEGFASWMRILGRVPGSVLWLYCKTPQTIRNLTAAAQSHGIRADRLVFAGFVPMDLYLSRFRLADLFLDSLPYNAGATCNDALWAGLPVLTRAGNTYVGRMAGSLLTALGLPELLAADRAGYEEAAVRLATEPRRLGAVRRRLAAARATSPLFDMTRFVAGLEAAYAAMHARRLGGLPPDHLDIVAVGD